MLVPGLGHLWLGRRKGLIFLVVLPAMFALGLFLEGRIFPVEFSQPLVALAALANMGIGLPYILARAMGYGAGNVDCRHLRVRQHLPHRRRPAEHARRHRRVRYRDGAQMMQSHFVLMLIFSLCVSAVFAGLLREEAHEQLVIGAKMFGGMMAAALVLGWLMLPFPI